MKASERYDIDICTPNGIQFFVIAKHTDTNYTNTIEFPRNISNIPNWLLVVWLNENTLSKRERLRESEFLPFVLFINVFFLKIMHRKRNDFFFSCIKNHMKGSHIPISWRKTIFPINLAMFKCVNLHFMWFFCTHLIWNVKWLESLVCICRVLAAQLY